MRIQDNVSNKILLWYCLRLLLIIPIHYIALIEEELPTLRVEGAVIRECRSRMELAAHIGLEQHRLARSRRSSAWLRQQTEAAEIDLDSGENSYWRVRVLYGLHTNMYVTSTYYTV